MFNANVTFKTAGNRTFTATDIATPSLTDTSDPVAVSAANASSPIVAAPGSATAGQAFNATVTVKDAFGNTATGYRGTVHFTSSDPEADLPADYTFTAADDGAHTFTSAVSFKTAGNRTLTATDAGSSSITGTSDPVAVSAADAASLTVTAPSSTTAGQAVSATVTVKDAFGNAATGYRGTVEFSSSDSAATLPPDHAFTAGDAGVFSADVTS